MGVCPSAVNILSANHCELLRCGPLSRPDGIVRVVVLDPAEERAIQLATRQLDDSLDYSIQEFRTCLDTAIRQLHLRGDWPIAELAGTQPPADIVQAGQRWLQVQLLGEVNRATDRFQRGVGTYPGLDDPVHFATANDLRAVFPPEDEGHLRIGCLAAAEEVPVCLAARPLVIRHCAVVGSTGAGKTSAVASLLQGFARGGWPAANIVVIDPHGEYQRALGDDAAVHSVLSEGDARLRVPFWALPASDILRVFAGSTGGATTKSRFEEFVVKARREFVGAAR